MSSFYFPAYTQVASPENYLNDIKSGLMVQWPQNKTINLVFHGHSVPAGYFVTPVVNTIDSYPFLVLSNLKAEYPFAVINSINTSIGGENSVSGQKRFKQDVLRFKPDVLFIDYALNDRGIGLEASKKAWELMIKAALKLNIKVILLTPSPDQSVNILETDTDLDKHAGQIRHLAADYGVGLIDSYALFKQKVREGVQLESYMSQVNHPNKKGHELIAIEIMSYFK
jgi:lysophospholipase L1-like esterase